MIRIVIAGTGQCGKTTALALALADYPREGFVVLAPHKCIKHTVKIDGVRVTFIDTPGTITGTELREVSAGVDGAIIFTDSHDSVYKEVVLSASPKACLRYVICKAISGSTLRADTGSNSIRALIEDIVRENKINSEIVKPGPQQLLEGLTKIPLRRSSDSLILQEAETKEVWLLSMESDDADTLEEDCEAYDTIGGAHEEVAQRFAFPVGYGAAKYSGFKTNTGETHLYPTLDTCVAAIIQHGLARIEKAILH